VTAIGSLLRGPEPVVVDDGLDDSPASARQGGRMSRPAVILPLVAAVLAATLAVALAEARGPRGPGVGEAIVTVHGRAFVARRGGSSETVTSSVRLHPGDRIDVRAGSADFELASGIRYQGLAGSKGQTDTSVLMDRMPTLRAGRLLVRAPQGAVLHAGIADVRVRRGGVARLRRSYAVTVGAYRGDAVIMSAGVTAPVTTLRSVQIASPGEVSARRPLDVTGDQWDRRYLAPALSLDRRLGPLAKGMRAEGIEPKSLLEAVRTSLPDRPSAALVRRLVTGRPSRLDLGIGLAVIGDGTRSSFAHRWDRAVQFHDAGASWGLVAMDVRADPDAVITDLSAALDEGSPAAAADRPFAAIGSLGATGTGPGLIGGPGAGTSGGAGGNTPGGGADGSGGSTNPDGGSTTPGGTTPGVTTPTVPGVTTPTTPITTPTVSVPGITTPAVPAVPVLPGVTTPTVPIVGGVVTTITGILTTLLHTTTTTRPRTTTTTKPKATTTTLLGCVIPGICI
jgi:hypothetical protein